MPFSQPVVVTQPAGLPRRTQEAIRGRRSKAFLSESLSRHVVIDRLVGRFGQEPLNKIVKHRRQEDTEQRHTEHAAEHGHTQGATHLRAGALGEHQRDVVAAFAQGR